MQRSVTKDPFIENKEPYERARMMDMDMYRKKAYCADSSSQSEVKETLEIQESMTLNSAAAAAAAASCSPIFS